MSKKENKLRSVLHIRDSGKNAEEKMIAVLHTRQWLKQSVWIVFTVWILLLVVFVQVGTDCVYERVCITSLTVCASSLTIGVYGCMNERLNDYVWQ